MNTEQIPEISRGTCMIKSQLTGPLRFHLVTATAYLSLGLLNSLSQESYALDLSLEHFNHLYIHGILSPYLILQTNTHHFSTTRDDKMNDCGL